MCIQSSPVEIRTPTHCNLIYRSMTAPPPVLSPGRILPPPSVSLRFHSGKENFGARFKTFAISIFFYFLKNCVSAIALT
jgi:hypothetical protein